jgi:WD40 repeat protein
MPSGPMIASASADGTLRTWCPPRGFAMRVFNTFGQHMQAVALTTETGFIVGGSAEGDVIWWSIGSGEICGRIQVGPGGVTCMATSPSRSEVAVSTAFGLVMVLDALSMSQLAVSVPDALDYVASIAFRPALPGLEALSARDDFETASWWTEVYSELTEATADGDLESDEEFRDAM